MQNHHPRDTSQKRSYRRRINNLGTQPKSEENFEGKGKQKTGYKKPPEHSRFKKGKSGNPKGRPMGMKTLAASIPQYNLHSIILNEAYREVLVKEGDEYKNYSAVQIAIRNLHSKAASGDIRASQIILDLVKEAEKAKIEEYKSIILDLIEMKKRGSELIRHRLKSGKPIDDIRPHPDDIVIEESTGKAFIYALDQNKENEMRTLLLEHKKMWLQDLKIYQQKLRSTSDEEMPSLLSSIADAKKKLSKINKYLKQIKSRYSL